jgi:hypothetical protein
MSTDGWNFSGDAVRFLQGGQRPRRVAHVRPCLPNSIRKPSAGADRWCRIRWTARRRLSIDRSWDVHVIRFRRGSDPCQTRIPKLTWLGATMRTSLRRRVAVNPSFHQMEVRQQAHSIIARSRIPLARPCFARDSDRPIFLAGRAPDRSGVHLFGRTCPVVPSK